MSYELFEKACAVNGSFEVIPKKETLLSKGVVVDKNGYINYQGETYIPNMVKLNDLPNEIKHIFLENKQISPRQENEVIEARKPKKIDKLDSLNNILFEQLQNIVDPEEGTDINQELKKAKGVSDLADKIISIADLSLKAEIFHDKKANPSRSLYQG